MPIKIRVGAAAMPDAPKSVHIEKIDDGFVISGYSKDGETKKFVKDLASSPTILARLLGVQGKKGPAEIREMTRVEDTDEDGM